MTPSLSFRARFLSLALAGALAFAGCRAAPTKAYQRYTRDEASKALLKIDKVGLEIGEFPIDGSGAVVDGDTIRVKGLQNSLRLLGDDTEETFKHAQERDVYAAGWESYLKKMRGNSERPVKMATPVGDDGKKFAQSFFEGVTKIRLERDHPGEIRDYYGRYLAYVFAPKNGAWVNYNVEVVRAGLSPYFTKYGRSRRFHKEFVEAQEQARAAKIGIWDPTKQHYPDYPERLKWWNARAEVLARFEKEMAESNDHIVLTRWDALVRLEQKLGQTVVVIGSVSEIKRGDRGPTVVKLSRSRGNDFDVIFFDKDVFLSSGLQESRGEFVRIRGVVNKYLDPRRNYERLQITVSLPGQVLSPSPELEALLSEPDESKQQAAAPKEDEPD
jgi:endonuclease YncB( thermonuclease family)